MFNSTKRNIFFIIPYPKGHLTLGLKYCLQTISVRSIIKVQTFMIFEKRAFHRLPTLQALAERMKCLSNFRTVFHYCPFIKQGKKVRENLESER